MRDGDKTCWSCIEKFQPGETRTLLATIDELRSKLLTSDVRYVTLWTRNTKVPQTFLVTPVYLVKK